MPNVNPVGSSAPPVSGSVEDPQQHDRAETVSFSRTLLVDTPDTGLCEQQGDLNCPEQLNAAEEKTWGDNERACGHSRKREEVIKEISISSTAFIGPACRPEPVIEDELSEFYKELSQIDQPDTVDGKSECVSQSCAPPDTVDGRSECVFQSWTPPVTVDRRSECVSQSCAPPDFVYRNSECVSQSWAPSLTPPAIKEKWNDHRNTSRPYPATRSQPDYRNTPQWSPHWSYPYQNQWQLPPPRFNFYPPPFSQPQGQQCRQIENNSFQPVPDVSLGSSPSNGPSLVLILMRGVPGSGKSTLARSVLYV